MTYSFTLMGMAWPLICDCRLAALKYPTEFQKKNPKMIANIVSSR